LQEGDLFHRIRNRAKAKEYFNENEVMDMFVQVTGPDSADESVLQAAADYSSRLHNPKDITSDKHGHKWHPCQRCQRVADHWV